MADINLDALKDRLSRLGVDVKLTNQSNPPRPAQHQQVSNSWLCGSSYPPLVGTTPAELRVTGCCAGQAAAYSPNLRLQVREAGTPEAKSLPCLLTIPSKCCCRGKGEVVDLLHRCNRVEAAITTAEGLTTAAQQQVDKQLATAARPRQHGQARGPTRLGMLVFCSKGLGRPARRLSWWPCTAGLSREHQPSRGGAAAVWLPCHGP